MAFSNKVINGTDITLSIGNQVIACATSHSIEITNAVREIACKDSGDFTSAAYGRFSWTVSTDALLNLGVDDNIYMSYDVLLNWMINKSVIDIKSLYVDTTDSYSLSGKAIITSVNLTAGDNENASYSVSMQGVDELSIQEGLRLIAPVLSGTINETSTTAPLTWTDTNTSPAETGYMVEYSEEGDNWVLATTTGVGEIGYTVTGLTPSTNYRFRITAKGSATVVDSVPSNVVAGVTTA
jgi:hypothetical protein